MNRVLLDQGLPRSAAAALREAGWDAEHLSDLGMRQSSDRSILEFARAQGRSVVTLDADFHALLAVANESGPSVLRIRQEGLKGRELAALLLAIWPRIKAQIQQGVMANHYGKDHPSAQPSAGTGRRAQEHLSAHPPTFDFGP